MWAMLKLKFRLMYNNKPLYIIMIAMAVILSGVFGNSFGSYKSTVAIVGTDPNLLKTDLSVGLKDVYGFKVVLMDEEKAKEALSNRSIMASLVLPEGYPLEGEIQMGYWTDSIDLMELDEVLQTEIQSAANIERLTNYIQTLVGSDVEMSKEVVKSTYDEHWRYKKPLHFEKIVLDSDYSGYAQNLQALVGMTIFFLTYSVLFTVGDMLEDQRLKTMNRFLVAPVKRWDILLSNFIPGVFIGFLQMVVMVLSGTYLFGIDWGSGVWAVLFIGFIYVFAIAALSLMVVSFVRNMSQLGALSPVILTGMAMIGGCMWPIEIVTSKILLGLSLITPHRWAIASITSVVQTGAMNFDSYKAVAIMFLIGCVCFITGERVLYRKSQNAL